MPEVPISNVPITSRSLTGVLMGLRDAPSVKGGRDLIGAQVLPWVQSVFTDEASLAEFDRTEPIRFAGIGGSYDTFVERNGFEPFAETRGWLACYSYVGRKKLLVMERLLPLRLLVACRCMHSNGWISA